MRVGHVITSLDLRHGGPVQALLGLVSAQRRSGLEVHVLATARGGEDASAACRQLEASQVAVNVIGPCSGRLMRHPELGKATAAIAGACDVLHLHGVWEQVLHDAAAAAFRLGRPYVLTPHGMLDDWSLRQGAWAKRMLLWWRVDGHLRQAAALHACSEPEAAQFQPWCPTSRRIVEPWGIDAASRDALPLRGSFRRQWPQLGRVPFALFVGRLHAGKGLDCLIEAMHLVCCEDAKLVIAGPADDAQQQAVEAMIRQHQLHDRILLTGPLDAATRNAAMIDADVLTLISDHENFGLVVVEAMAMGCPVIVSDQVHLHTLVSRHGTGSVTTRRPQQVAQCLDAWLGRADRRRAASKRCLNLVASHFDWADIGIRWCGHYERLCHQQRQRGIAA